MWGSWFRLGLQDVSEPVLTGHLQRTWVAANSPQLVENARDGRRLEIRQVRENKVLCEAIHPSVMAFCGVGSSIRMTNASNRKIREEVGVRLAWRPLYVDN